MIRIIATLVLSAAPGFAHMMSMSTGDATISGNHLDYFLRMPLYEIANKQNAQAALFQHIRFSSGGHPGRPLNQECHEDREHNTYLCAAYYEFSEPVSYLDVDCSLYAVTVPNHVHLLRAEMNGKPDRAIFDYNFTHATLLFRPPTAFETTVRESAAGAVRAVDGWIQLLFLLSLALAARSRRELLALAAMFIGGQIAGALIPWRPPPRFVELAAALTIVYLATEIIFLPDAGLRWLVAGCVGFFHGLYFALFLQDSEYRALWVLTGAAAAELAVVAGLGMLLLKTLQGRYRQIPASMLMAFGFGWFLLRWKS